MDGGILCNYPIKNCMQFGVSQNNIIGIYRNQISTSLNITSDTSILDYLFIIIQKIICKFIPTSIPTEKHYNEIELLAPPLSLYGIYLCTTSIEERVRLLDEGIYLAKQFMVGCP